MKFKKHLFYTIWDRKVSRTYGGTTYTVKVCEFVSKGNTRFLAERTACNRGHKGSLHEAWSAALMDEKILKAAIRDGIIDKQTGEGMGYFDTWKAEKAGWCLRQLGEGGVD